MAANKRDIKICRVYEPPETKDGLWFLVDRLWPRDLKKDKLLFNAWLKEIASISWLRTWFNHEPGMWQDFTSRYIDELSHNHALIEEVIKKANQSKIILFYAAKDKQYNHARVLKVLVLAQLPETAQLFKLSHR